MDDWCVNSEREKKAMECVSKKRKREKQKEPHWQSPLHLQQLV
jgi:hypothetical protein